MPHLVVLYTANLDAETDMTALCRTLADTVLAVKDETSQQAFPTGGTRVLAYPAAHSAVADGQRDYAFVWLNLRIGLGRSEAVKKQVGEALLAAATAHFAPLFDQRHLGMTLQIDEGREVYNGKAGNLHALFGKP